jgi:hypothetical protein|tara:strand:+ start:4502 stop:4651 length:150 start_codon:yes stop_codon:yes gene_type:complete
MPLRFKSNQPGIDQQKSKNKRTSIGNSNNTYPKNKNAKSQYKKYRGQGK